MTEETLFAGSCYQESSILAVCNFVVDAEMLCDRVDYRLRPEEQARFTRILSSGVFHWYGLARGLIAPEDWVDNFEDSYIAEMLSETSELDRLPSRLSETLFVAARESLLAREQGNVGLERKILKLLRRLWKLEVWNEFPTPTKLVRIPEGFMRGLAVDLERIFWEVEFRHQKTSGREREALKVFVAPLESPLFDPIRSVRDSDRQTDKAERVVIERYQRELYDETGGEIFCPLLSLIQQMADAARDLDQMAQGEMGDDVFPLADLAEGWAESLSASPIHQLRPS